MKFRDFTLHEGAIQTRREWDTDQLDKTGLQVCRSLLQTLRAGETFAPLPGSPVFGVSLGPPAWLWQAMGEGVEAPGRFFCLSRPGQSPFQVNLVLTGGDLLTETDDRAVSTLLGLTLLSGRPSELADEAALEARVRQITQSRPCLATAMQPTDVWPGAEVILSAASASTAFAAALLLESA